MTKSYTAVISLLRKLSLAAVVSATAASPAIVRQISDTSVSISSQIDPGADRNHVVVLAPDPAHSGILNAEPVTALLAPGLGLEWTSDDPDDADDVESKEPPNEDQDVVDA